MANDPFFDSTEVPDFVRDTDTGEVSQAMTATAEPEPAAKMEFHVQMKAWTMDDIETFIVQAAADQLVRRFFSDRDAKKIIEDRLMQIITGRMDRMLGEITAEIIDQPVTSPAYGGKAVTMREMIGLHGREYLTQKVGFDGKPSSYFDSRPRIEHLVDAAMDQKFAAEIKKATTSVVVETQAAIKAAYEGVIAKEKARVAQVIAQIGATK